MDLLDSSNVGRLPVPTTRPGYDFDVCLKTTVSVGKAL